jgi:hypothetical protein
VYVANFNENVQEFSEKGAFVKVLDEHASQAVAIDPSTQDVFVVDEGGATIRPYTSAGVPLTPFSAGLSGFSAGLAASGVPGAAQHFLYASNLEGAGVIFGFGEAPEAPITGKANPITGTTAMLHGVVNPLNASEVGYHFAYNIGSSCEGGATTTPATVNGKEVTVESEATGLQPNQHYTFCLVASNAFGATAGSAQALPTAAVAPSIDGESASGPNSPSAILEALVNPNNQVTTYSFEYSTSETGGVLNAPIIIAPGGSIPAGFGDQPVSVSLGGGLTPGVYYYRAVAENATGTTHGTVQSFTRIGAPLVGAAQAQNATASTVVLSGTVDPQGADTTYRFEIVSEAAYRAALAQSAEDPYAGGPSTPTTDIGSDYTIHATGEVPAGELLAGTTYHYALVATNQQGTTIGPDKTFTTTLPTPPTIATGGAENVTQNSASISGTINTEGLPTTYGFEIGLGAGDYGPPTGLGSVGAGASEASVTLALSGLQPGVTYHYRITATSAEGTSHGTDGSFTTGVFANAFATPPAPLAFVTIPSIAFPAEEKATGKVTVKTLTRAQKLANALKACKKKKQKSKRAACEKSARSRYGPVKHANRRGKS